MAGNYGSVSRSSVRRKRRRRNDMIRTILSVVLVCVLLLVVGFLGVKALKNNNSDNETQGGNTTTEADAQGSDQTTGDSQGDSTEESTEQSTEESTEEVTTDSDAPVMVNGTHTVWVDAGHGGTDWGSAEWLRDENGNFLDTDGNICEEAASNGAWVVREKNDNLDLALALQEALIERGVTVIMTRTEDTFYDNKQRAADANETDAECFIALHRNYMLGNDQVKGFEIWGVNWEDYNSKPEKATDQQLAELIRDQLLEEEINEFNGIHRNSIWSDDFSVLWRTNMPALILEMGYMSNTSDNELFRSNLDNYADAIADAIVTWLNSQE